MRITSKKYAIIIIVIAADYAQKYGMDLNIVVARLFELPYPCPREYKTSDRVFFAFIEQGIVSTHSHVVVVNPIFIIRLISQCTL
jgi:hypothetical protein